MKRKIEYKGKALKDGEWVKGYICSFQVGKYQKTVILTPTEPEKRCPEKTSDIFSSFEPVEVDPDTVGMFLMKDMDGNDIYEGDMVRQDYNVDGNAGYHIGTARFTTEGAQIGGLSHYHADGTPVEMQPHPSKRIQMRTKRCRIL